MKILVDTSIWSLAFRRNKQRDSHTEIIELQELIREVRGSDDWTHSAGTTFRNKGKNHNF